MSTSPSNLHEWIPLFVLPMVALPGDLMPLHIFEPRYRALVADCLDAEERGGSPEFGICLFHEEQQHEQGCIAVIDQVLRRYPDGRLDILAHGSRRFRTLSTREEKPYREAHVLYLEDEPDAVPSAELLEQTESLCGVYGDLIQASGLSAGAMPDQLASYRFAGRAISDPVVRQRLLELGSERLRLEYLAAFFERAIPRLRKLEEINHRVKTNGHFKAIPGGEESLAE